MCTTPFIKGFKICFTIFIISISHSLFSQNNIEILSGDALQNAMDLNKINGVDYYTGMFAEHNIKTSNAVVSVSDSAQIVHNIKALPGVVSCVFKPSQNSLIVKTHREENQYVNLVQIKNQIVPFNVFLMLDTETIYRNTSH